MSIPTRIRHVWSHHAERINFAIQRGDTASQPVSNQYGVRVRLLVR